ncbi:MAG: NTP transferase domain-containing protein [Chitinivibrionales bacterium]|nr:NTP transferase domain-containing protein [Chitinivibrionales bacterium]MBD3358850.1 NTP transferase domain-containing protein [Chitinivibrionales bacterium]
MDNLVGVILVAGKGSRIFPFSTIYPKPLLPVCNVPLLHYQIALMKSVGISRICIVIGYMGYKVVSALGDGRDLGVSITYIEQEERLGIAHAVGKLERYVTGPFLLILGDIYFVSKDLGAMVSSMLENRSSAVLAVKHEHDPELIKRNFTVVRNKTGRVVKVIEKPRTIDTNLKGCGIYLFEQSIFDAVRRTPRTAMRDEYELTDAIQILIENGHDIRAEAVVEEDINLTYPEDILKVNLFGLKLRGADRLVGENVSIHPKAKIIHSIIGDNVTVEHPITIRNSLIMNGTNVLTGKDVDSFILTPQFQLDCHKRDGSNEATGFRRHDPHVQNHTLPIIQIDETETESHFRNEVRI